MNRFGKSSDSNWKNLILPVCFFFAVMIIFYIGLEKLDKTAHVQQLAVTEQNIRRAAVHCYAVEGRYPPNFAYLKEHYGILVDEAHYVVHYLPIASNLMPDIMVFPIEDMGK